MRSDSRDNFISFAFGLSKRTNELENIMMCRAFLFTIVVAHQSYAAVDQSLFGFRSEHLIETLLLRMCVGLTPPKDWFSDQTIHLQFLFDVKK